MNKIKLTTAFITGLSLSMIATTSNAMDERIESALIDVCKSAAQNKGYRMKSKIKSYNLSKRNVALKVMCNGDDIINFAAKRGATKTANILQKSIGGVEIIDVAATSKINVNFKE